MAAVREAGRITVALVYASDFATTSPGGIAGSIEEAIAELGGNIEFVVVGVRGASRGENATIDLGGRRLKCIPVVPARRKFPWIPLNLEFTARLFFHRKRILGNVDLVHAHRMELAIPFLFGKRRPVLLTIHGASKHHIYCTTGLLRWRLVRWVYDVVEGLVFARVDRVICVSSDGLAYYLHRYPRMSGKFVRIPNALSADESEPLARSVAKGAYGLTERGIAVAFVGRLSAEKQVSRLVEAFAGVARDDPQATLLIAGDGPERPAIMDLVGRLRIPNVKLLGLLTRRDVRRMLAAADVLVLPSRFEGFPMAVLEALSAGVPVVASAVGGVTEILTDGLKDFILPDVSVPALKEKILDAARRRSELQTLCVRAASRFRPGVVFPELEHLYRAHAQMR